ncbi:amino acid adenylation domain-containing protein [Actinoplanes sp. NPDC049265]|uniref:amino acid adenylation domain-containing protein n=1 Tax=Actinoplanes sp. NPDC049265 TaxID=3363902 RepID=UPI00372210EF
MASNSPHPRPDKPRFAVWRGQRQRPRPDRLGIPPADRTGPLPASYAQQRLWLMQQLDPGSNAYNLPIVHRLHGALDPAILERALGLLVDRHEALRTVFDAEDGEPRQRVQPAGSVRLRRCDARDEDHAAELVRRDTAEPFDLHAGPVLRALLVRLADDDHVLALTVHHVAGDGWSLAILQIELSALYAALLGGTEAALPPLPVQYADFAQWERRELSGAELAKRLSFWLENLRDAPTVLGLPTDRPRPATGGSDAGMVAWRPPAELVAAARALSRAAGVTLFMTLLAAFQVVLSRHVRGDDVLVGTPIANRNRSELEGLAGMFVNTVVLRGDLSGDPSFRELLARTRANTTAALAHAELPFDLLVERIAPRRDLSINPVVQVLFQLLPQLPNSITFPGVTAEPFDTNQFFTRMDLEFHVYEDAAADSLTGHVWYRRELFDEYRMRQFLDQVTAILRGVVESPDSPISTISLVPERPFVESNETDRVLPVETLPELLEGAVARAPDAIAVVDQRESLTYAELGRRANKLAHLLRHRGVRAGALVGLCLDRGADLVVGILGILKAGAAYVPLDPEHPAERTRFVLDDSGITAVVTQRAYRTRFAEVRDVIHPDDPGLDDQPGTAPEVVLDRDSLAYAIYTSGSTGRPKAVLMPGVCVVNLLLWQERTMGREENSRTAQFITATFDYSVQEIFSALLGGTLVIPPDDIRLDPARLARWIDDSRITRIYAPTTVLRALLEHVDPYGDGLSTLRHLCQGGEPLVLDGRLREVCRHRPALRVHNHYGPAETQLVTGYTLPEDVDGWPATAPIGTPIDNTRIHLLDDSLRPVPDGVPGQVCISGIGLARGYLARPELTEQRFIADPLDAGPRMYLSGDLARRLPDGNLDFLGRIDNQVKIRGIRIELGEIEAALAGHPAVAQAAVAVREDDRGDKRLVAYVVSGHDTATLAARLREHAEALLPAYMVPSTFLVLADLPRTTSGKTDRQALPAPATWSAASPAPVAPRDDTEATLCGIYADVLDVPNVGVHDDFFALGGHSLLASRVVSRIRAVLGRDLPLRMLFDQRTPARVAQALVTLPAAGLPPIAPRARTTPAPISLAQQQMLTTPDSLIEQRVFPVCPYGFRLRGPIDYAAIDLALTRIVARHEPLRTGFRDDGQGLVQIVREPSPVRAHTVELTGHNPDGVVGRHLERPFDLVDGTLLRAVLMRLDEDDHILLLVLHHIAGDGWSFDILVREFSALYTELTGGPPAALPDVPTTYTDFAQWEHDVLSGSARADHEKHWRAHLAGAVALELPADRPRKVTAATAGSLAWTVAPEVTSAARRLARAEGVTLYETMLGAFAVAAAGLSGRDDILVTTPFANRGRPEVDNLIGFFAKIAALRVDLSDDPPFGAILRRVQAAMLGAHDHQDLPYAAMQATTPGLPLPLVQFQLISSLAADLDLPGVTSERFWTVDTNLALPEGEIAMWLFDDGQALTGTVAYDGSLFDPATIRGLLSAVESALHVVSSTPSVRASEASAAIRHARS